MAKNILRFIIQTIGLILIGAVFSIIGALIGGKVSGDGSLEALGLALLGLSLGYFLGIIIGIILINKVLHQRGSLLLGILGCIIGAVIPWITIFFSNVSPAVFLYLPVVLTPVLGLAGFYLKH
jgi:hypothetical protein